jgi:hypothetical protein
VFRRDALYGRSISNAFNNMTQVRCLFLQHSTIVSFRYLPQLQYLEELGVEGNRIVSFAHAPHLPSLISINITGAVANDTYNCAA